MSSENIYCGLKIFTVVALFEGRNVPLEDKNR